MDIPRDNKQGRLGYWLFYTQRCGAHAQAEVMRTHCEERGKSYVVTPPQWSALLLLLEQDGLTIGTMSQMREIDAPTATGIIKPMELNELVERRHDREDRRVVKVFLTEEGRDISSSLAPQVEQFELSITRGFSKGEQDRLLAQLQQIIANVSEPGPGLGDRFSLLPKDFF